MIPATSPTGTGITRPIYVLSSINDDITLRVPHLPLPGETTLSTNLSHSLGGKGANTAVAASKASSGNTEVHFIGAIGDDTSGASLLERLSADHRVRVDNVACIPNRNTGQAVIFVDDSGENCIVVHGGANSKVVCGMLQDAVSEKNEGIVVALHMEIPIETVCESALFVREIGGTVVLNSSPVPSSNSEVLHLANNGNARLWVCVDVLIVNEGELTALCKNTLSTDNDDEILKCVDYLREGLAATRANIIVTLGARGAILIRKGERKIVRVDAVSVDSDKVVDTTGAGDCLTGYICAGITRGWDLERALKTAVAAASLCVQRMGAADAMPTFIEVKALMEREG